MSVDVAVVVVVTAGCAGVAGCADCAGVATVPVPVAGMAGVAGAAGTVPDEVVVEVVEMEVGGGRVITGVVVATVSGVVVPSFF